MKKKKTCGILAGVMVLSMMTAPLAGLSMPTSAEDIAAEEPTEVSSTELGEETSSEETTEESTEPPTEEKKENTNTSGVVYMDTTITSESTSIPVKAEYQVSEYGVVDIQVSAEISSFQRYMPLYLDETGNSPTPLSVPVTGHELTNALAFNKNAFHMQVIADNSQKSVFEQDSDISAYAVYNEMDSLNYYNLIFNAAYFQKGQELFHVRLIPVQNSNNEKVIIFGTQELSVATSKVSDGIGDFGEIVSEESNSVALTDGSSAKRGTETVTTYENGTIVYRISAENIGNASTHPFMPSTTIRIPNNTFQTEVYSNDYGCDVLSGSLLKQLDNVDTRNGDVYSQFLPVFQREGTITLVIKPHENALIDKDTVISVINNDVSVQNPGNYAIVKKDIQYGLPSLNTNTKEQELLHFYMEYAAKSDGNIRIYFYNQMETPIDEKVTYQIYAETTEVQNGYDYYNPDGELVYWSDKKDDWRFEFGEELKYEEHYDTKKTFPDTFTLPNYYKMSTTNCSDGVSVLTHKVTGSKTEYSIYFSFDANTVVPTGLFGYIDLTPTKNSIVKVTDDAENFDTEGTTAAERVYPASIPVLTKNISIYTNQVTLAKGDLDGDGELTVIDLVMMQNYLHKKYNFSKTQFEASDINGDGKSNVFDLCLMKRLLLDNNDSQ